MPIDDGPWPDHFPDSHAHEHCPPTAANHVPRNVRDLHPSDISAFISLGDSVTAGFGMSKLQEHRGRSFTAGGDKNVTTVSNIIKHYSPRLSGQSRGSHFVEICFGYICPSSHQPEFDRLNSAQTGAMVNNLEEQVNYLIEQSKKPEYREALKGWKIINILIGFNDLCFSCILKGTSPEDYKQYLTDVLMRLRKAFPKSLINLVELFRVSQVYSLSRKSSFCKNIHRIFPVECVCAFLPRSFGDKFRDGMDKTVIRYNRVLREVAAEFQEEDDFAVNVNPALQKMDLDVFDTSFLSHLDCFHPSTMAYQYMAVYVWNAMISREAHESEFDPNVEILCADENTRFLVDTLEQPYTFNHQVSPSRVQ
uniref:Uncharacterized protein n=1 Tax=Chromera velia CCMP2878 TaxID=1169474 RepID=A0A0G4HHV4_9ALVE|eukprot:Cvel_27637.t1-p1 / transcript=Cvel_27637.t1 / gene=Cvel_27637 / organism=Chromera_velia_CCMP2878 / gene_product=Phospholipase B1, membrane-associated, putative / transcript_product=Phospholipase B1, membrane-associated, putative / location=Cvel_scaffold3478:8749-12140(-) / protein_length=364 / sequence_SO=supercontig / SO=protein_coding / is_pseudo=false